MPVARKGIILARTGLFMNVRTAIPEPGLQTLTPAQLNKVSCVYGLYFRTPGTNRRIVMRFNHGLLVTACLLALSASASAQQTQSSASSSSSSSSKPEITADDKRMISQGYQLKVSNGQKVFCKMEPMKDSHFQQSICHTADEWQKIQEQTREVLDASRRTGPATSR